LLLLLLYRYCWRRCGRLGASEWFAAHERTAVTDLLRWTRLTRGGRGDVAAALFGGAAAVLTTARRKQKLVDGNAHVMSNLNILDIRLQLNRLTIISKRKIKNVCLKTITNIYTEKYV